MKIKIGKIRPLFLLIAVIMMFISSACRENVFKVDESTSSNKPGSLKSGTTATKLFSSGFESPVTMSALVWNGGQWMTDLSGSDGTGSWPLTIFGATTNWAWVFENGNDPMSVPEDGNILLTDAYGTHTGSKAWYASLTNTTTAHGRHAQYYTQGASFTSFYVKLWMKTHWTATSGWRTLWGAKTGNSNDINPEWLFYHSPTGKPYWVMGVQHLTSGAYWWRVYDRDANNEPLHPIPVDTWMQVEYHFKYNQPVPTTGGTCSMFLKVDGVTIFNETNHVVADASTPTAYFDRFFPWTLYAETMFLSAPVYDVIDDVEIWDDVPADGGGGGGGGTAFVTGQTLSPSQWNSSTDWRGMKITVGAAPLTLTELGRWVLSGNTQAHTVKLVTASGGAVPGGSVTVATLGAPAAQFKYVALAAPVTLSANTAYFLVSQETSGGDYWLGYTTLLSHTGVAVINNAVNSADGVTFALNGTTDNCAVPVAFKYATNSVPSITTTSLPGTIAGESYNQTLAATGGDGALVWSLDSGSLPVGLSLSSAGVISGTPTTSGTSNFTVRVADSDGVTGAGDEDTQALAITVNPAGGGGGTAFVTGQTLSPSQWNSSTDWRGMKITVGAAPLTVTELGRWVLSGNTQAHTVKLVTASGGAVPGGSVTVATLGAPAAQFKYVALAAPVTLSANTAYFLVSQETSGGDYWLGYTTLLSHTGVAVINNAVNSADGVTFALNGTTDNCNVPVAFKYATNSVPSITTTSLPGTIAGESYNQTLAATGGNGALVWSLDTGSLPAGLSLSSAGVISGTSTTAGTANFTVRVADSDDNTGPTDEDTQALSIVVTANSVPSITTTSLPGTIAGESYNQTLAATGGDGALVWSLDSGSLPAGLSLSSAGVISGTSTTAGTANFTVRVADSDDNTGPTDEDTQALSIVVTANSVPSITTATLPNGMVNTAYSQTLAATGGNGALVWSLDSGSLPVGLSLSSAGVISGTPTTSGTSNFTVRVADSDGVTGAGDEDTQALAITVGGTAFVTGQTLSPNQWNNSTDWRGMKITVGAAPLTVTELGRWVLSGNTQAHTVKLVTASGGAVPGGSVSVATLGAPAAQFKYVALAAPVTLSANTAYFLVSQETSGGDYWCGWGTLLSHTGVAVINNAVNSADGVTFALNGTTDNCAVPVAFKYATIP